MTNLKYIYNVQLCGTTKGGIKVHFSTKITSDKVVHFAGGQGQDIKSALNRMVAMQKPTVFEENNVIQSSVFVEGYTHRTEQVEEQNSNNSSNKTNENNTKKTHIVFRILTLPFKIISAIFKWTES